MLCYMVLYDFIFIYLCMYVCLCTYLPIHPYTSLSVHFGPYIHPSILPSIDLACFLPMLISSVLTFFDVFFLLSLDKEMLGIS
jgi:hypothetical protein